MTRSIVLLFVALALAGCNATAGSKAPDPRLAAGVKPSDPVIPECVETGSNDVQLAIKEFSDADSAHAYAALKRKHRAVIARYERCARWARAQR